MAFTYVTITHTFETAADLSAGGEIDFTPISPMHNGVTIVKKTVTATLSSSGVLSQLLAANTDPDTIPTGTVYQVDERVVGQPTLTYYVQVPHNAGNSIDLRDLAGWVGGTGSGSGTVSSINGEGPDGAGNITLSAADVGAQLADGDLDGLAALGDGVPRRASGTWGLVSGTPDGTKFLRDDGTWAVASGSSYTSENARDDIAAALVAGSNVTITPNDGADTITISAASSGSAGIPASTVDAKGDLIVGTANDTVARRSVGTDGQALLADSAATTGVSWGAPTPADASVTNAKVASGAAISADKLADGTTNKVMTATERAKLAGVAAGATAYTDEQVRDVMGVALVAGSNVSITPNDVADTITIAATVTGGSVTGMVAVDTIASLKAVNVTGLTTNDARFVQGFYSAGDGGAGVFRYVSGDSATAVDGMIVAPNTGTGRWRRDFTGTSISVKWFGARGDGVNDDRAAIQTGIDFVKTLSPGNGGWFIGGTLFFPDGTYMLSSRLVLPRTGISPISNVVRLQGESRMATVLKATSAFPANTAMIEWAQTTQQCYLQDIRNFTMDVMAATNDVKCIWHRQIGAINTTDPSSGVGSVAQEWFNLTLDNLLIYCVTSRHTSMFKFENGNRYAEMTNILFDPSFGDFNNGDLERDSLLFDVVSQFGSPPRYTAESEDSVGFFKCALRNINSGLIQSGRSRIWRGRLYESVMENVFCNGGQDDPQFEFIDCFRISVKHCGSEGAAAKQMRFFKVRASLVEIAGVSPGDPRHHKYWAASTNFGAGRKLAPTAHASANGPNRYLYSVNAGTTGTVEPTWTSAPNPGNTVTDNAGRVYTNTGEYVVQDVMSLEECYDNYFYGKYSTQGTPSAPQRQTLLLTIDSVSARNVFRGWTANLGGVNAESQISIAAPVTNMNLIEGWDNTLGHQTGAYYRIGMELTDRVQVVGDSSITLTSATDQTVLFSTNLTSNRTVTAPSSGLVTKPFKIVKTATGGSGTLSVLGLHTLGASEKAFVKVEHNGTSYVVTEKGALP